MSALALDRQIRPIYDALDTGSNKSAIVACNKLLKKHPKNDLIKSLKALALIRSQKVEEALVICDEVLESKPTHDGVLTAMMHVLRGLGRHNDMVTMFEEAYKKQPANEDLGAQTFFANVRASHWKSAHQIATRMYKQFQEERYLYWSVISAVLQAKDTSTPPAMRPILYKLAHRLITSSSTLSYSTADRFHLHLSLLRELQLYDEAEKLLTSDVGKNICATSLSCNEVRRDIWLQQGLTQQEGERAERLIVENRDRNWLEFLAVLDATFVPTSSISEANQNGSGSEDRIKHSEELFSRIAADDGLKDRSGSLALLELEKRARTHGLSKDPSRMLMIMQQYFEKFGDKACCFEDLKPYLELEADDLKQWISFLEGVPTSFTTVSELRRLINSYKIIRHGLPKSEITVEKELARVEKYTKYYFAGLSLGAGLPSTELQPVDDLVLLAGNTFVNLWTLTNDDSHLLSAVYVLEFALTKSKQCFLARLILIRIYRLLCAPALALDHYRAMQIKQVQHDTLSHLILSRASTFSLASTGDLTLATECLESTQIYLSNSQETGDFVVRAFTAEKYSQIPEFIVFEDRLDNSLQRDTVKMEHLRMRLTHEPISSDIIDMELIELKFIFDRTHHDNRDFAILPNYQPRVSQSLHEQTLFLGKPEGQGWLSTYLKVYIRAFQQASDLDDTVEEKLLIGDRPKQTADFDKKLSLKERLLQCDPESMTTLTQDEARLVEYASALADWLEPYHNYARPPPSVVLAEAAKQTELKTGHPLKGFEVSPSNGTNGHHKKDEEPPVIQGPPETVLKYFDTLRTRFEEVQSKSSLTEILHVATLAQEAFLLLVIESLRFKTPSVVKINKLGALVTSFKELYTPALSVLKVISNDLVKRGELEGSTESRKTCIESCTSELAPQVGHDFIFTHAKKVADSRRKVLEGVGKGIARLSTVYT
ncbi:actin cytoskeleton organization protein [Crassisporium funariophilum]|nr:actin cytoskeleton organization protein [Crassisporium funariophilum]